MPNNLYDNNAINLHDKILRHFNNYKKKYNGFTDLLTVLSTINDENICLSKLDQKDSNGKNIDYKIKAKDTYSKKASDFIQSQFDDLKIFSFKPNLKNLPYKHWYGFEINFVLESPWYSKDERKFHLLDNPVCRDHVFGVPYMPASSWKGMLRWACRMKAGLLKHLKNNKNEMTGWKDPDWIIHLFGNERAEKNQENIRGGSLCFYSTWFNKIGFEVINPHSRETKAGTTPILYEVVPLGTEGKLSLLYAPSPGDDFSTCTALSNLMDSVNSLLRNYGISAKRTAGWGTASIKKINVYNNKNCPIEITKISEFIQELEKIINQNGASDD